MRTDIIGNEAGCCAGSNQMTGMHASKIEGRVNPNQSVQVEDMSFGENIPPSYSLHGGVPFHLGSIILTGDIIIFV